MNDMVFNKKFKSLASMAQETKVEYEDYQLAMEKVHTTSNALTRRQAR